MANTIAHLLVVHVEDFSQFLAYVGVVGFKGCTKGDNEGAGVFAAIVFAPVLAFEAHQQHFSMFCLAQEADV